MHDKHSAMRLEDGRSDEPESKGQVLLNLTNMTAIRSTFVFVIVVDFTRNLTVGPAPWPRTRLECS